MTVGAPLRLGGHQPFSNHKPKRAGYPSSARASLMRRPAPTVRISPQQLRHFAAATVALTVLLAVFAGGEGAGLGEELEQRSVQNQLEKTEADQFGTSQLKFDVKRHETAKSKFAFSEGAVVVDMSADWGSGSSSGPIRDIPHPEQNPTLQRIDNPHDPGAAAGPKDPRGELRAVPPKKGKSKGKGRKPSVEEEAAQRAVDLQKTLDASRERSGRTDLGES